MENSVDPDQLASLQKPADLDQRCFQKNINPGSAGKRLKTTLYSYNRLE